IKGVNLAFVGDSGKDLATVCRDLMLISSKLGINFYLASPKEYQAEQEFLKQVYKNAELSGSKIVVTEEPKEAVAQADFVCTDEWTWYRMAEDEIEKRAKAFIPRYQINSELMKAAPAHCKFMHCLPAMRGQEVTGEVIDGKQSIVFDEAENRLYTEEALLVAFIGGRVGLSPIERERESKYAEEIGRVLERLS
ncbi:MAG: putrescine carbamoyltransferase, partial [Dehalococcoidia bacterium]|nr:putrescine carbamoyltransferase [Dehalococcoidia bacterium]